MNVTMKVVRYGVDQLAEMLPTRKAGRFYDLKVHVKREIAQTPVGQFFLIQAKEVPKRKKDADPAKERVAFELAIKNLFKTQLLPWTIVYSPVNDSYLVVRERDYKAERHPLLSGRAPMGSVQARHEAAIAQMPRQFTTAQLRTKLEGKLECSALRRLVDKKVLKSTGYAAYEKTKE